MTLQGTIFPGDWTFTIRGVYTPTAAAIGDDALIFHHEYFDERLGHAGIAGWFIVQISDPGAAATIAKAIDDQFRNSSAATKTGTEQAFQAGFATMLGNVSLLMGTIGTAVVFAILLVTANAMMMSARERTSEVAVMKTIGFSDRTLFGLVISEAGVIAGVGALLGLGVAKAFYRAINFNGFGFLPGFDITTGTLRDGRGHRAAPDARQRARARGAGRPVADRAGVAEGGIMKIPLIYNARSVLQRPLSTAFTALGIALVVAVFIGMLALGNGLRAALARTGSDRNVLVLRRGADSELASGIARDAVSILAASPHVAIGPDGRPLISPEVYVLVPLPHPSDTSTVANVVVRGVSDQAWNVRANVQVDRRGAPALGPLGSLRRAEAHRAVRPPGHRRNAAVRRTRLDGGLSLQRGRVGVRVRDLGRERAVHARVPRRGLPVGDLPAAGPGRVRRGQAHDRGRPAPDRGRASRVRVLRQPGRDSRASC